MAEVTRFPGTVEWSGENPGIFLKQHPDGPFTTLASFFRVVLSPHGRGHALVLMQSPNEAHPQAEVANLIRARIADGSLRSGMYVPSTWRTRPRPSVSRPPELPMAALRLVR